MSSLSPFKIVGKSAAEEAVDKANTLLAPCEKLTADSSSAALQAALDGLNTITEEEYHRLDAATQKRVTDAKATLEQYITAAVAREAREKQKAKEDADAIIAAADDLSTPEKINNAEVLLNKFTEAQYELLDAQMKASFDSAKAAIEKAVEDLAKKTKAETEMVNAMLDLKEATPAFTPEYKALLDKAKEKIDAAKAVGVITTVAEEEYLKCLEAYNDAKPVPRAPGAPEQSVIIKIEATSVTLQMVAGTEYSVDGKTWYGVSTDGKTIVIDKLIPETEYPLTQRLEETATTKASDPSAPLKFKTLADPVTAAIKAAETAADEAKKDPTDAKIKAAEDAIAKAKAAGATDEQLKNAKAALDAAKSNSSKTPTIKLSKTTVKKGKKATVKITSDSGNKITVVAKNKRAKNKKFVKKIKSGKTAKIKFTKTARKGIYKFEVTVAGGNGFKELKQTIKIKVKK